MPFLMNIHEKQERLLGQFDSTSDFISKYLEVYDLQKLTPFKIFLEDIPYIESFEKQFINELFLVTEKNENNPKILFDYFLNVDTVLNLFSKYEFIDLIFRDMCIGIYFKGVSHLIDQQENLIMKTKFDDPESLDSFFSILKILIFYFGPKVSITKLITYIILGEIKNKISNPRELVSEILNIKPIYFKILKFCKINKFSYFLDDKLLDKRISSSVIYESQLEDCQKKSNDTFDDIIVLLNSHIKSLLRELSPEEGYLKCMNYASEIILNNVADNENVIEDLKSFSITLLDQNNK